jgi:TRAP-type mannitol/chloroaromatic compound transport system permease small subunit
VLLLMIALVYGSWSHFLRSFDFAAPLWSRDSTIDIGLPIWPTKLLVPVSFSVLCLRLVLQIWGYGRAFIRGDTYPVAVPLIQDAAAQAAAEADQLDG